MSIITISTEYISTKVEVALRFTRIFKTVLQCSLPVLSDLFTPIIYPESMPIIMNAVQSAAGLPNDPIFIHLAHAARNANKVIIRDPVQNLQANRVRFLQDILQFRSQISSVLPGDMVDEKGMIKNDHVYILISAPSSYQFLVALFAILAIGGAAVLLRETIHLPLHLFFQLKV